MSIQLIDHLGRTYEIVADQTTIGPGRQNSIFIPEMSGQGTVLSLERSGNYWQLVPTDGNVVMELNGASASGTQFLRHMDIIQANGVALRFVDLSAGGIAGDQASASNVRSQPASTDNYGYGHPQDVYQGEYPPTIVHNITHIGQPQPQVGSQPSDHHSPTDEKPSPDQQYSGTPQPVSTGGPTNVEPLDKKALKRLSKKYGTDVANLQTSYALSAHYAGPIKAEYSRLLFQRGLPNTRIEEVEGGQLVITKDLNPGATETTSTAVSIAPYGNDLLIEIHHYEHSTKSNARLVVIRTVLLTLGVFFWWTGVGLFLLVGGIVMLFSKGQFPESSAEEQAGKLLFATVLETLETALINCGINPNAQLNPGF